KDSSPAAVTLLQLLCWYAPEAIPVRLLLSAGEALPASVKPEVAKQIDSLRAGLFRIGDANAALRRYCLGRPPADGPVPVHRLIQGVTAAQIAEGQAATWRHAAACLVTARLPADPGQPSNWPVYSTLLPHARAVLDDGSDGLANVARYLAASGDYAT